MASTIRKMTLNIVAMSVPVGLRTASERSLPTFSKASPDGNKYERFVGTGVEEDSLLADLQDTLALAQEIGVTVEQVQQADTPKYRDTVTGKVFEEHEIKTGVWEGTEFFEIKQGDISEIDELTRQPDLTIQTFVPLEDVPWERVKNGYFLVPDKGMGRKALNLIRLAMEQEGKAGVVLLMPKSRVHLAIVYAKHGGLMVSTLAFAEEWAQVIEGQAAAISADVTEAELEMAVSLVNAEKLNSPAAVLDNVKDLQAEAKLALVEKAKAGLPVAHAPDADVKVGVAEREESLLEQALRESIAAVTKQKKVSGRKKAPSTASPDASGKRRQARPSRAASR